MKSKRTNSTGSSRASSHQGIDEVDGSSSDSDSDDDERVNQTPVTYEDVAGAPSPVFTHKIPKPEELQATVTVTATSTAVNPTTAASTSRKGVKSSKSSPAQPHPTAKKHHHQQQQHHHTSSVQESSSESSSSDEKTSSVAVVNQSLFLKLVNFVRAFFDNRKNWSVTEESFIICFGFMVFTILVGCILHYLMA